MPDRYGFDILGTTVRCVEEGCQAGGPAWQWPVEKRERHQAQHERARAREATQKRDAALAKARKVKAQAARENERAYRQKGDR